MSTAGEIVAQAVGKQDESEVPPRVREVIERHRQSLLGLASALLAAGRDEEEIVAVILKASESFSLMLKSHTEGAQA